MEEGEREKVIEKRRVAVDVRAKSSKPKFKISKKFRLKSRVSSVRMSQRIKKIIQTNRPKEVFQ